MLAHYCVSLSDNLPPWQAPTTVWMQLIDEADETASAPVAFEYLPSNVAVQQATKFVRASSLHTDWQHLVNGLDTAATNPQSAFMKNLSGLMAAHPAYAQFQMNQ